jgi:microcystin-dependent protein
VHARFRLKLTAEIDLEDPAVADPFLSEIRLMSFVFAPKGWALCNGQLLPINQNQALFALLGTTYGGNGQTTFALPDLRGRVPIHTGSGHTLGERGGEQAHTLSIAELPTHQHPVQASPTAASKFVPTGNVLARGAASNGNPLNLYNDQQSNLVPMAPQMVTNIGGSQAHLNMQPFLTLSFCIALQGIFPSQN